MNLKISREDFNKCPTTRYLIGGENTPVIFEVPDDFIRDLCFHLSGHKQNNYTTMLIELIFKAHGDNWNKLSKAYPNECLVVWCYQNIPDFYKQLE